MALRVRVVQLDPTGSGSVSVMPAYFAGVIGGTAECVTDSMVARDEQKAVNGEVAVTGGEANGVAQVYLDFSA